MEKESTRSIAAEENACFSKMDLKTWLWVALLIFTIFTRFHHLGDKPFHHDESLYGKYIWNFHVGQGYKYDPMQHGPFMFHASQVTLTLFGVNDYSIRILPALTGIALLGFIFALRKRMPPGVALFTGWMFAINAVFMYFQRFLRHDPFFSLFAIMSVYFALLWLSDRKTWQYFSFCASCACLFCIKENAFVHFLTMYLFGYMYLSVWLFSRKKKLSELFTEFPMAVKVMGTVTFWGISFVIYAGGNLWRPGFIDDWDQAVKNYWIAIFALFFVLVGYLVYLGESVRSRKEDNKILGIDPSFFKDSHIYAIGTVIFFGIIIILYTTFFDNKPGFWGATHEWYTYWLHQHSIKRIAGPFDYYHHQMLIYAFLPLSVTLIGILGRAIRRAPVIFVGYLVFAIALIAGLPRMGDLPHTDQYFTNQHIAYAIAAFIGGMLMAYSYLRQRATFKAFLVFWTMFSYIVYSYLQEKVPWLTMHIITPMILYAGIVIVEFFKDRKTYYKFLRNLGKVATVIVIIYAVHTSIQLCWYHEADPVEQMVYVQTTYEIPKLVEEIEELAYWENTLHKKELPMIVNGHATWPMYWYLRDWKGISYGNNVQPDKHLMVICNWEDRHKFAEKCGDRYVARKYGLRAWYLPKYSHVTQGGKFLRNAFRFIMYREKFNQTLYGAQMICVFTRKDVSRFQKSVDIGNSPKKPDRPNPPTQRNIRAESSKMFGSFGSMDGRFNAPKGMAVDSKGNLFVADQQNHRIQKFDSQGKYIMSIGGKGSGDGQFNQPTGLGIDAQDNIFVADTWNHRIQKFDASGKFLMAFGDDKTFWAPKDIAIDGDGYLYIANTGFHSIKKYTRSGKLVNSFGSRGNNPTQFTEPVGLALDKLGRLYVADTGNKRISVFDKDGHHVKQINAFGLEEYYTEPFLAIDLDSEQIFMTDSRNNNIQIFDLNGNFKGFWGREGNTKNNFKQPMGIACGNGKVYVSEAQNHRIQSFDIKELQ